jgi:hypothetical protein
MDKEKLERTTMPGMYASFLVRLWCDPGAGWCAEIEHVQSGKSWTFGNIGEALDFLRQQAENKRASE